MTSPITYPVDDKDLDDTALWAVIDSAAASHSLTSSMSRKSSVLRYPIKQSPPPPMLLESRSPPLRSPKNYGNVASPEGFVLRENWTDQRPCKVPRYCNSRVDENSPLTVVKHVQRTPTTPIISLPEMGSLSAAEIISVPNSSPCNWKETHDRNATRHTLSERIPSVSLFKDYQRAAQEILENTDYIMIAGKPFIKKSGWRKISFYFNLSFEIKDKTIEFDENRNVRRAEFVVRAFMQGGRFCDGWGSCELREKKFLKPNHDVPTTAETRAKNRACQDLLGIGEYRPRAVGGYNHNPR